MIWIFREAKEVNGPTTNESTEQLKIDVYPNPTNDLIYVNRMAYEKLTINVTTQEGKVLISTETSDQITRINLSKFESGIYLIQSFNEEGVSVEKVIKI